MMRQLVSFFVGLHLKDSVQKAVPNLNKSDVKQIKRKTYYVLFKSNNNPIKNMPNTKYMKIDSH